MRQTQSRKQQRSRKPKRRAPLQERAHDKVELILEGATRLIDEAGVEALTTNAIANRAGVSIGTLYQYFNDKHTIIEALTERELKQLSVRMLEALQGPAPQRPGERVGKAMKAFLATSESRVGIRRKLLAYALTHRSSAALNALILNVINLFATGAVTMYGQSSLTRADAFVLTHAFAGVMRGVVCGQEHPPLQELETAVTKLLVNFALGISGTSQAKT